MMCETINAPDHIDTTGVPQDSRNEKSVRPGLSPEVDGQDRGQHEAEDRHQLKVMPGIKHLR